MVSISSLGPRPFGGISSSIESINILVKRLDGRVVLNANTGRHTSNTLGSIIVGDVVAIPFEAQKTLNSLYRHLNTRDTDLDELLKQL